MVVLCILLCKFLFLDCINYHLCMTRNQFDSKDKCILYLMYTLDMFHILDFAFVLWIYGTLNKMNE